MTDARDSSALHSLFQRALLKSLTFSRKSHQSLPKTNENCGRWVSRPRQARRPPRVRTAAFTPHPPHLLHHHLMVMGFALSRRLARMIQPDMRFVFLRSAFCLRLPSDPTSRWTPLPLANSFHHRDLQGTCTPKLLPMPGTHKYPPAEPEVLRLLAPQRGLTAID